MSRTKASFWKGLLGALLFSALSACNQTSPGDQPPPGGNCPTGGEGTLRVGFSGLPPGVPARARLEGPDLSREIIGEGQTLTVPAGPYTLRAERTADTHPIVRQAFVPTALQASTCVRRGQEATLSLGYRLIPSSGRLWMGESLSHRVYGFPRGSLSTPGTLSPDPNANTQAYMALTFDQEGNLWVARQYRSEPHLYRYPAASLAGGNPIPDRRINIGGLDQNTRPNDLAFDEQGHLWIAVYNADTIFRLDRDQLAGAGSGPTTLVPRVLLSVDGPSTLAFDREGNLWVGRGEAGTLQEPALLRYDRGRLDRSIPAAEDPDRTLIALHWNRNNRLGNSDLAFDREGNLWVMSYLSGTLYRVERERLSGSGTQTLEPSVRIFLGNARLSGMAFDESGGLWIAYGAGQFARLSPEQLRQSSQNPLTPAQVFQVPREGNIDRYPHSLAFFPAPAGLPLYAR
ncbi:MAG: hypothetical protein NZ846_07310 [Thermus sp.]|uniref:Vgb family protein n=1 Tax=Thermus sp. TaxID=275 RepID=UPI0025DA01C2|nr:hypothetical protein [Thermus sp.]MCS7218769.1 hypothetical protein [Thermus sp.]